MNEKKIIEVTEVKIAEHFLHYPCPTCGLRVKHVMEKFKHESSVNTLKCENCGTVIQRNEEGAWEVKQ